MGYRALLFCPDEKTARAVTQVLTDLEFAVEASTEPFAAVKKLMAEHFDAVVVDCDNEQNAALLFKSARNSGSNQSSLSVAVVEGQAGVAKAFRIGANLVLTRPINIEQAKGTLRVARGLLRKGDPSKGLAAGAPAKPVAAAPVAAAAANSTPKPESATGVPFAPTPRPVAPPAPAIAAKPAQAAAAAAHSAPAAQDQDLLEIDIDDDATVSHVPVAPPVAPSVPSPAAKASKAPQSLSAAIAVSQFSGGAASAPARAPQLEIPEAATQATPIEEPVPALSEDALQPSVSIGSTPSFSYGGASTESLGGGSKKTFIIVAVVVLVLAGLYVGWTQFHDKLNPAPQAPQQQAPVAAPAQNVAPRSVPTAKPSTPAATPASSAASSVPAPVAREQMPDISIGGSAANDSSEADSAEPSAETHPAKPAGKNSPKSSSGASPAGKASSSTKAASEPIIVKSSSSVHAKAAAPVPDASAPSISSIAPTGATGNLSSLISTPSQAPKPVLQTVNLSQGVSQGLVIKKVQPAYPQSALHMRQEGSVQLLATISKSGNITAVKIVSGQATLAKAAVEAVKQWKYKPYLLNGEPVEIQTPITVNFKLPQ